MTLQDWLTEPEAAGPEPGPPHRGRRLLVGAAAVLVLAAVVAWQLAASTPSATTPPTSSASRSTGAAPPEESVVVSAVLHDPAAPALPIHPLTLVARGLVPGEVPARVPNFDTCSAHAAELVYLPVEIRSPELWLAGTVEVQPTAATPPGIGRLGFFFQAGAAAIPCPGGSWSASDRFQASNVGQDVITGYVVLDRTSQATAADIFRTLRLRISDVEVSGRFATLSPPTVGALCPGVRDAICAPLG